MLIRRARPEDHLLIGEVTVAAYAEFTLGPGDPYVARLRDAGIRDREAELWVAVPEPEATGSQAVWGSVTVCPNGSSWRELAAGGEEGEFRMLAVSPTARGRGVGEALVRHCLHRFCELGASAAVLSSLPEMSAAHRLYRRLGFDRLPQRDWSPVPGVQLLAFGRELAS